MVSRQHVLNVSETKPSYLVMLAEAACQMERERNSYKKAPVKKKYCLRRRKCLISHERIEQGRKRSPRKYYSLFCYLLSMKRTLVVEFEPLHDSLEQSSIFMGGSRFYQGRTPNFTCTKKIEGLPTRRLFYLVECKSWQKVIGHAKRHPHDAKWRDSRGWTVLHRAICDQAPFSVVYAVWEAYPGALFCRCNNFKTPLHCAFRWGCSNEVLRFLAHRCKVPTELENILNLPNDIVKDHIVPFIGNDNPLLMQDINGNSVLHYMVVYSSPLEQIELILKMAPQSVSLPNASGKTPMNTAYQHKMSSRCLSLLDSLSHQKKNFVREHGLKPSETAIKYDKKFLFEKEEVF